MKIIVKINENNELVAIHCTNKNCKVEVFNYHDCVICGDATEIEMDMEYEDAVNNLHQIYDADTYLEEES